jgi:hypothetical protein
MHLDGDAVADPELVDCRPEPYDGPHVFMADREILVERQTAIDHCRNAVAQDFDVGGADRHSVDPHQHLGRRRSRHRLSTNRISSGPPSTQAFIFSGTRNSFVRMC